MHVRGCYHGGNCGVVVFVVAVVVAAVAVVVRKKPFKREIVHEPAAMLWSYDGVSMSNSDAATWVSSLLFSLTCLLAYDQSRKP